MKKFFYLSLVLGLISHTKSDGSVIIGNGNNVRGNNVYINHGNNNKVNGNDNYIRNSNSNRIRGNNA